MKVLWFTNTPSLFCPGNNPYNGGGWISSAEKLFSEIPEINLGVSFVLDGCPFKVVKNKIHYYPLHVSSSLSFFSKLKSSLCKVFHKNLERLESKKWKPLIDSMMNVISDFEPDVIHIWGSEEGFGLVSQYVNIPIILHLQGILIPYWNAFLPPSICWNDYMIYNLLHNRNYRSLMEKSEWLMRCYREKVIFKNIKYVFGRTDWDYRCSQVLNQNIKYYHSGELLREQFYKNYERQIPNKLVIVTTISNPMYKGYDLILKTAYVLKYHLGVDFSWLCFGNIKPNFIEHICGISGTELNIELKGVASAENLIQEELNSTLYFHSSYIDNSPNSVCEAQILGLPVISTNVGGISSLISNGNTGFLIPSNDPYQAAYLIDELYRNRSLNIDIGSNAKVTAKKRHDKKAIVEEIVTVYKTLLS